MGLAHCLCLRRIGGLLAAFCFAISTACASAKTYPVTILGPARLAISILPQSVMVDGGIRIRCTVPRRDSNRLLRIEVENTMVSTALLPGAVTHERLVLHVPCEASWVACTVTDSLGHQERVAVPLTVVGCSCH